MAIKTYYLYNTTASEVTLGDIGLRIGAGENYQFDSNEIADNLLSDGGDLEASINAGDLVLTEDATIPPATQYSIQMALAILSLETLAEEVTFDNSGSGGLTATNLQDAVNEISTGAVTSSPLFFDAYTTSEDNITSGWTDVPLNVEREKDADGFTHATDSPEVTINEDFRYLIIARVGVFQNGGNSRSNAQFRLSLDTGSGFSPVDGSLADIYSRNNAQGEGNGVVALVLDLNDGDKIKIQARREDGGGTIFLKSEACSLTMSQLKGEKGVKGDQGPPGTQGINVLDDGTQVNTSFAVDVNFTGDPISSITETTPGEVEVALQSRISVKDNDSLVTDTPHSILNFKGEDVDSIVSTGNQVDITIDSGFTKYIRNILVNSLEIETLKNAEASDILSYFVDSFEDDDEIDGSSVNFSVQDGYVSLQQGGNFSFTKTTKAQWDDGTFTDTESFDDVGGDGAIRKEALVVGGVTTAEDFEDITNISTSTSGTTTLVRSTVPSTVYAGTSSLEIDLDFSGSSLTETSNTEIDLGAGGVDVSGESLLNIYVHKGWPQVVNLEIQLEDTTGNTYTYPSQVLFEDSVYQKISFDITDSFPSITETALRYIRIILDEDEADQTVLEVVGQLNADNVLLDSSNSYYQTFSLAETTDVDRILIRARWSRGTAESPLNVELQTNGGVTLASGNLAAGTGSGTFTEYTIAIATTTLTAGTTYRINVSCPEPASPPGQSNAWEIHIDTTNSYAGGELFTSGGTGTGDDLHFTLYSPPVQEKLYFDQFEFEAASTFEATGSWLSEEVDLGLTPDAFDDLMWTETGTEDDIEVRFRTASTSGGLSTAVWSTWYTNPVTNNVGTITPQRWVQFEIRWINGTSGATTVVKDLTLEYSVAAGTGSATVISEVANTSAAPQTFVMIWEEVLGSGSINYSISRDGKSNWQSVPSSALGDQTEFTAASGTQVHIRAIISGNARLYGWGVACDEEFI